MTDKEKRSIGAGLLDRLIQGQRSGATQSEIMEGIKAGLGSDYLSLDEGLSKGSTIADPMKYAQAMDGKDEAPRKAAPLERDIVKRIERAKKDIATSAGSPEYRKKVVRQKKAQIHREMTKRGTDEITARIRGYDVTLIRLPELEQGTDSQKIKMYVNGNEIPDKDFNAALEEISGLNDGKAFNAAAQAAMDLKAQAGIQAGRTVTQAGIEAASTPLKEAKKGYQKNASMLSQLLGALFKLVLSASRAR